MRLCTCPHRANRCSWTLAIQASRVETSIASLPRRSRANVKQIDYLVTTHYHADHVGGVAELVDRLPIRNFVDHGPTSEQGERAALYHAYVKVRSRGAHMQVNPGDQIPVAGLSVRVLSSGGGLLSVPLEGGGIPNPLCSTFCP